MEIFSLMTKLSTNLLMQSLRSMIGYVPQTIFLRDGTVSENIAFGIDKKMLISQWLKKLQS